MSDETNDNRNENAFSDAVAAILVVVIPVIAVIYWLSGLPVS